MKIGIFGFIGFALAVTLLTSCSSTPAMPEVNDENCKMENIRKLDPSIPLETRQEFASKCLRRDTAYSRDRQL